MISLFACMIGFVCDLFFGDPYWLPHPIRFIGNWIGYLDKKLNKGTGTERCQLFMGGLLVIFVILPSVAIPIVILAMASQVNWFFRLILESIMCYQLLALKSLKIESLKVYDALKEGNLENARYAVSMIVGRDTKPLNEEGIIKAAVETVAENTSDGVIAPLFYMMLGGAPLAFFYKAINTMDSMVGYKNDRYLYFGCVAAKLDDVVNYIPARIAAFFMIVTSYLLKMRGQDAIRIFKRDRYNHASPNSAQTESVCAGALGVKLAGDAWYFGKLHHKKTIGDAIRPIEIEDIYRANQLLYGTGILCILTAIILKVSFLILL
ncbi:MAG: adenosylcobinamide-phosphate synthase CbiB [Lachnospiraceae bacterium]